MGPAGDDHEYSYPRVSLVFDRFQGKLALIWIQISGMRIREEYVHHLESILEDSTNGGHESGEVSACDEYAAQRERTYARKDNIPTFGESTLLSAHTPG